MPQRWHLVIAPFFLLFATVRPVFADAMVIPNTGRIPLGDIGSLEGGAMIARTDDGAATWYNPAGLVRAKKPSISSNAAIYELNNITIGKGPDAETASTFNIVPAYLGYVGFFGKDNVPSRLAWGFSISVPVNWKSQASSEVQNGIAGTNLNYGRFSSTAELRTLVPSLGISYAVNDRLSIGAAAHVMYSTEYQQYSLFERHDQGVWFGDCSFVQDSASLQGQLSFGASWRPYPAVKLGLMAKLPSINYQGRTSMYYSSSYYYGNSTEAEYANTDSLSYRIKRPGEISVGAAYQRKRYGFEVDAHYRMGVASYSQFEGDLDIDVINYDQAGTVTLSQRTQVFQNNEDRAIMNYRVGGYMALTNAVKWHVGAFTDKSTMKNSIYYDYAGVYQKVDLYGFTTGVSITDANSSLGLGVSYTRSGTMVSQIYDIKTSDYAYKPSSINILGFILTGKYFF